MAIQNSQQPAQTPVGNEETQRQFLQFQASAFLNRVPLEAAMQWLPIPNFTLPGADLKQTQEAFSAAILERAKTDPKFAQIQVVPDAAMLILSGTKYQAPAVETPVPADIHLVSVPEGAETCPTTIHLTTGGQQARDAIQTAGGELAKYIEENFAGVVDKGDVERLKQTVEDKLGVIRQMAQSGALVNTTLSLTFMYQGGQWRAEAIDAHGKPLEWTPGAVGPSMAETPPAATVVEAQPQISITPKQAAQMALEEFKNAPNVEGAVSVIRTLGALDISESEKRQSYLVPVLGKLGKKQREEVLERVTGEEGPEQMATQVQKTLDYLALKPFFQSMAGDMQKLSLPEIRTQMAELVAVYEKNKGKNLGSVAAKTYNEMMQAGLQKCNTLQEYHQFKQYCLAAISKSYLRDIAYDDQARKGQTIIDVERAALGSGRQGALQAAQNERAQKQQEYDKTQQRLGQIYEAQLFASKYKPYTPGGYQFTSFIDLDIRYSPTLTGMEGVVEKDAIEKKRGQALRLEEIPQNLQQGAQVYYESIISGAELLMKETKNSDVHGYLKGLIKDAKEAIEETKGLSKEYGTDYNRLQMKSAEILCMFEAHSNQPTIGKIQNAKYWDEMYGLAGDRVWAQGLVWLQQHAQTGMMVTATATSMLNPLMGRAMFTAMGAQGVKNGALHGSAEEALFGVAMLAGMAPGVTGLIGQAAINTSIVESTVGLVDQGNFGSTEVEGLANIAMPFGMHAATRGTEAKTGKKISKAETPSAETETLSTGDTKFAENTEKLVQEKTLKESESRTGPDKSQENKPSKKSGNRPMTKTSAPETNTNSIPANETDGANYSASMAQKTVTTINPNIPDSPMVQRIMAIEVKVDPSQGEGGLWEAAASAYEQAGHAAMEAKDPYTASKCYAKAIDALVKASETDDARYHELEAMGNDRQAYEAKIDNDLDQQFGSAQQLLEFAAAHPERKTEVDEHLAQRALFKQEKLSLFDHHDEDMAILDQKLDGYPEKYDDLQTRNSDALNQTKASDDYWITRTERNAETQDITNITAYGNTVPGTTESIQHRRTWKIAQSSFDSDYFADMPQIYDRKNSLTMTPLRFEAEYNVKEQYADGKITIVVDRSTVTGVNSNQTDQITISDSNTAYKNLEVDIHEMNHKISNPGTMPAYAMWIHEGFTQMLAEDHALDMAKKLAASGDSRFLPTETENRAYSKEVANARYITSQLADCLLQPPLSPEAAQTMAGSMIKKAYFTNDFSAVQASLDAKFGQGFFNGLLKTDNVEVGTRYIRNWANGNRIVNTGQESYLPSQNEANTTGQYSPIVSEIYGQPYNPIEVGPTAPRGMNLGGMVTPVATEEYLGNKLKAQKESLSNQTGYSYSLVDASWPHIVEMGKFGISEKTTLEVLHGSEEQAIADIRRLNSDQVERMVSALQIDGNSTRAVALVSSLFDSGRTELGEKLISNLVKDAPYSAIALAEGTGKKEIIRQTYRDVARWDPDLGMKLVDEVMAKGDYSTVVSIASDMANRRPEAAADVALQLIRAGKADWTGNIGTALASAYKNAKESSDRAMVDRAETACNQVMNELLLNQKWDKFLQIFDAMAYDPAKSKTIKADLVERAYDQTTDTPGSAYKPLKGMVEKLQGWVSESNAERERLKNGPKPEEAKVEAQAQTQAAAEVSDVEIKTAAPGGVAPVAKDILIEKNETGWIEFGDGGLKVRLNPGRSVEQNVLRIFNAQESDAYFQQADAPAAGFKPLKESGKVMVMSNGKLIERYQEVRVRAGDRLKTADGAEYEFDGEKLARVDGTHETASAETSKAGPKSGTSQEATKQTDASANINPRVPDGIRLEMANEGEQTVVRVYAKEEGVETLVAEVPAKLQGALQDQLSKYAQNYPPLEENGGIHESSLHGMDESFAKWSQSNPGTIVDFVQECNQRNLPHQILADEKRVMKALDKFGVKYDETRTPFRMDGSAMVYLIPVGEMDWVVLKFRSSKEDQVAQNVFRLFGKQDTYKVEFIENFNSTISVEERVGGVTLKKLIEVKEDGKGLKYGDIEPGGKFREQYLEQMADLAAEHEFFGIYDPHPGNFKIWVENGELQVRRIDFEGFGFVQSEGLRLTSEKLGLKMDEGETQAFADRFQSRWADLSSKYEGAVLSANQEYEVASKYTLAPESVVATKDFMSNQMEGKRLMDNATKSKEEAWEAYSTR